MSDQATKSRNWAGVRIAIGVLIAIPALLNAPRIQPSDDAATLAGRALGSILIAALSLVLIVSGIAALWKANRSAPPPLLK